MQFSLVFAILVLAHVSSAWVRFREPQSRRNFLNQTLIEKLQNCAGKETQQCGLCGEGPGEIQTNVIPSENYTVVDPDVRVLAVELGFRAGLNGHLEFRICNVTNDSMADGIACNETTPLLIGSDVKWYPSQTQNSAKSRFRLPRGLVCERCVLQVKYTPGPESTMKEFRFFDCALLNITHPTKMSSILKEELPKDVFPPGHAVLGGGHITAEIRSSDKTTGEVTDFIRSMNRTFTSVKNRLTVDGNRIDSTKHGVSNISVRRLPLGERTASLNFEKTQPTKSEIMSPEVTNVLSNGTVNDRRVLITTKIFNMTNSNSNVGDSNVHNRARITMIEILPNNEDKININRAAESELNRTEVVRNVMTQPTKIDTRVGMFNVSRNGLKNTLNNSVNFVMVNETSIERSNVETAIFENAKTNGSRELDINRSLDGNANNNRKLATNKERVVGRTNQNATVDWKIYNSQPVFYDEYHFYNDTGTNNDTYYYEDFNSDTNSTFVRNLVDTVTVNSNASNEELLVKSASKDIVNTNTTGQTMFSTEHQGVNKEILNHNLSSSATFIRNTTGLADSKAESNGLGLQINTTKIDTNSEIFVQRNSNANVRVNSGLVDSNNDARSVLRSKTTDIGESVVRSLGKNAAADTSKDTNRFVSDTKTHTFTVMYSGVSRDRGSMGLNSRFVNTSEIQNNHMVTGLDTDSRAKNKSKEENVKLKTYAENALTNQTVDRIVINNEGGSSSHMFKTSGTGVQHSISTQAPDIFDKTSLINETVRLMTVLTERPTTKLNSVDAVGETFTRDINSSVIYTEIDVQMDKINQQVVNVPHTIIVLPKYRTVPHLGQASDTQSFGSMSGQKTPPLHENLAVHHNNAISGNKTYTYQDHASLLDLYNETRNHKSQGNAFQTAHEEIVTQSIRNVTLGINTSTAHPRTSADITAGKGSGFLNDAIERTPENASHTTTNVMNTLEEINYFNHDEMFFPTSPVYQFTKRLSYSISAADRRPNYANVDMVRSAVESSSRNSGTSIQSSNNRLNNVLLNTGDSVKTKEDIQGNLQITREDLLSSGTKVVISKDASSQAMKAVTNNTTGNRANTWGSQSSNIDINNRLIEGVSSTEPFINFEAKSIPHFQEAVISTSKTLVSDISTQAKDRLNNTNSTKVTQATTADNSGFLDISTRAYDMYIGLVSTTVEPLSHSPFVKVVNYSTVAADSIFPAPKQDISSSSDVVSSAQSQANTESFLMSIFSSTPSPTATGSVPEEASIPAEANIPQVAQEPFLAENSNFFENVNFLTDSEANVDHLGGVPIHGIQNRTFGGRLDLEFSKSRNHRNRNIVGKQIISSSNFDISNRLDGRKDNLAERNSNDVIWKAAVRGSAIPVEILTINPNLQTHNVVNVSVGRETLENNKSEFTGTVFLKNENMSSISNNNNNRKIVKNVTIGKAIVWQSMPLANLWQSGKTNIEINEWHSKPVNSIHWISTKERSTIPINSLSNSDKMATVVSMVHSALVDNLRKSDVKTTNADVVQLNPLTESDRSDKAETSIDVYMPSGKGSETSRNLDIFINGNAAINKVTSTKNKNDVGVIKGIMSTPEVMPPIKVNSQAPSVTLNTRNVVDLVQNEMPKTPLLHTTKTNITLFTPYVIGRHVTNKNYRWQLQKDLHTSSGLKQDVDYVTETADKTSDEPGAKNLSVSAIWDINRGNTDGNVNRGNNNEKILIEPIPVPTESNSGVPNPNTVFRQDGSNTGAKQNIEHLENTTKISKDAIAVDNQIQSDVNRQVLRTLEALVLELDAMKMQGSESRRPVVDSSLYSRTVDRSLNRNIIHSSYPVFSVHPNLLTLPSEFVNEQIVQRNSRGLRASENHKLLNVLGISNQRDWNANITLNSSISTENINNTMYRNSSNQQIVNLSEVRSKAPDEFATLLSTFADVSSTRSQQEMNPSVVKLMDYTEQFLRKTDAPKNTLSMSENIGKLTETTQQSDNRTSVSEAKQQTVITADSSTFINPFTGERMHLSTDGKQFADKFIVRGTGNLQHLKGVDKLFRPNFTVGRYNYIPTEGFNNSVSIQGKYLYGEMRRNEMGQFEPVPLASKFKVPLTDKMPQTTNINLTKEETDNVSTMNTNTTVYTGLPAHALVNTVRTTNDKTANKMHNIVLFNVTSEVASKLAESSKDFDDNSTNTGLLIRTSEQEMVIKGQEHAASDKIFYNQEDLLRTNSISLNQTKPLTGRPIATRKIASDFKAYSISCKEGEMFVCKAVGKNRFIPGMVWWCFSHCKSGVCPPEKCSCRCENVRETSNIKRVDSDNTSGAKRRKKVIQLTLNTPSNGSVRASEDKNSKSKSETMLRNIIRPKVLNATVSSLNKTHTFSNGNESLKTVQLFDTPTVKCKGINAFANTTGIDELCTKICSQNMCPEAICMCFG